MIRSGDYYQFEGDPEDEEDEDDTTTGTTTAATTPTYQGQLTSAATAPGQLFAAGENTGEKQYGPRERLQRNQIRAVWPNATSAHLDVLANYTCPYSPAPSQ